jgi:hypothetical protein
MELHWPYRAALELERGAGTLFAAQAAAVCLRLFRDKQYLIPGGDLR